jgi:hypothetical protein
LVFENYGAIGERRATDFGGKPVDTRATFLDGTEETGVDGLRRYLQKHRENDFIDTLCRQLLAYSLGRTLIPSDDPLIEDMRSKLAKNGFRFNILVESIVTSPQFLNKRGIENLAQK